MSQFLRNAVSKKKRRFVDKKNNFDLDLSYVTKRVIAMGFPSEDLEGMYRNPYSEVIRFLHHYHDENYKVYNLCSERGYDPAKFSDRVAVYPFDDHNPPPFVMFQEFCNDVKEFLDADEKNTAVIHCKAGKGRTGTMICAFLLHCGDWQSASDAMSYYAAMRTYNQKGVTIPSQIRYIHYYDRFLKHGIISEDTLYLRSITLNHLPRHYDMTTLSVSLMMNKLEIYKLKKPPNRKDLRQAQKEKRLVIPLEDIPVFRDVKVIFEAKPTKLGASTEVLFTFWFNTGFIDYEGKESFTREELDKANKDRNNKIFPVGFNVEIAFKERDPPSSSSSGVATSSSSDLSNAVASSSSSAAVRRTNTTIQTKKASSYSKYLDEFPSLYNF